MHWRGTQRLSWNKGLVFDPALDYRVNAICSWIQTFIWDPKTIVENTKVSTKRKIWSVTLRGGSGGKRGKNESIARKLSRAGKEDRVVPGQCLKTIWMKVDDSEDVRIGVRGWCCRWRKPRCLEYILKAREAGWKFRCQGHVKRPVRLRPSRSMVWGQVSLRIGSRMRKDKPNAEGHSVSSQPCFVHSYFFLKLDCWNPFGKFPWLFYLIKSFQVLRVTPQLPREIDFYHVYIHWSVCCCNQRFQHTEPWKKESWINSHTEKKKYFGKCFLGYG